MFDSGFDWFRSRQRKARTSLAARPVYGVQVKSFWDSYMVQKYRRELRTSKVEIPTVGGQVPSMNLLEYDFRTCHRGYLKNFELPPPTARFQAILRVAQGKPYRPPMDNNAIFQTLRFGRALDEV